MASNLVANANGINTLRLVPTRSLLSAWFHQESMYHSYQSARICSPNKRFLGWSTSSKRRWISTELSSLACTLENISKASATCHAKS